MSIEAFSPENCGDGKMEMRPDVPAKKRRTPGHQSYEMQRNDRKAEA
jgi:hypothetical protein